jgi:ribonuclease HI
MPKTTQLYYAIVKGNTNNTIVNSWDECKALVHGYKGAIFKKFTTKEEADVFIESNQNNILPPMTTVPSQLTICSRIPDSNTKSIIIYTDGSLVRKDGLIYAGFGIYIPDQHFESSRRLTGKKTNNRAELTAIISAIQMYKEDENIELCIYTDSQYSIGIFGSTGLKYQKQNYMKNTTTEVPNADLVKIAIELSSKYILKFIHVRSHTSEEDIHSKGNDRADTLAVRGAVKDYIHMTEDIGIFKLTFGKYKQYQLKHVPTSYLTWLATSENFEELCRKKEEYRLEKEIVLEFLS